MVFWDVFDSLILCLFFPLNQMMSTISRVCDSEIGGWRVSVETIPDIQWIGIPDALRAERAQIERVGGFIMQRLESVVSAERMITIIPSMLMPSMKQPPIPCSVRSKSVSKKRRKRPMMTPIPIHSEPKQPVPDSINKETARLESLSSTDTLCDGVANSNMIPMEKVIDNFCFFVFLVFFLFLGLIVDDGYAQSLCM